MSDHSHTRAESLDTSGTPHYRLPIRRPVTVAMLFLTLLVFGWRSYRELPISLMPEISYPTLTMDLDRCLAASPVLCERARLPVADPRSSGGM